ncbi:MAG: 50S ribosomal protein L24 [Chloroflexi bacterium]|nr:50S ribosomal protein L24 [Chloroflexota bacterium]
MPNKIKRGDTVLVVSGKDKGARGEVIHVNLKKQRVFVEGVNIVKRHMGRRTGVMQTGIVEGEASIHISNVVLVDADTGEVGRVRWRELEDGTRVRTVRGGRNG